MDAAAAPALGDAGLVPEARAQGAGWCLRFLSGAVRGRTIALKPGINVLGSGGECEVMLPAGEVQPRHLVFTVGELVVAMQRLGAALVRLNGEEMLQPRRSVVAGDIVSAGDIDFQLDRTCPAGAQEDRMFVPEAGALPQASQAQQPSPPGQPVSWWLGGAVALLALMGIAALSLSAAGRGAGGAAGNVNLTAVERALMPFPEVEVVAGPSGQFSVRGYVESKQRQDALQRAMVPFGPGVSVRVHSAEAMVEQARRYVGDPGVAVSYAGHGRLVLSGVVEDAGVRQKIRRLGEDLHPSVLVADKVQYREPAAAAAGDADRGTQWDGWQSVLPARMVGITEDASGLRHIQLSNGNRYYEGSLLRSGAELQRIEADGVVLSGGPPQRPASEARR